MRVRARGPGERRFATAGRPRRSATTRLGLLGAGVLAAFALMALVSPLIGPYPAGARAGMPFQAPSARHWLGTDDIGHDILSEVLDGARSSLAVGFGAAVISKLLALLVGLVAGTWRGAVDGLLMRSVDLVLVVPTLPLVIFLAAYVGGGALTQVLLLGSILWAASARLIRSHAISTRTLTYVRASRSFGAGRLHVLRRHILPAVLPLAVAAFVRAVGTAILLQSSLTFLGLGDPTQNSWGTILYFANARGAFLSGAWLWWIVPPGACIALVVVATAFAGLLVEDRADPRLRRDGTRRAPIVSARLARSGPLGWSSQPDLAGGAEAAAELSG